MKKQFAWILVAAATAVALTGCGGKKDQTNPEPDQPTTQATTQVAPLGSRTKALMSQIKDAQGMHLKAKGKMNMTGKEEDVAMDMYLKGTDVYLDMEMSMGHVGLLTKDTQAYFILHDQKMYFTTANTDEQDLSPDALFGDLDKVNEQTFTTGSAEVNGVTYDYEETKEDDVAIRYYYDQQGNLKVIQTGGQTLEVLAFDSVVDDSKFTLPEGYTESKLGQ